MTKGDVKWGRFSGADNVLCLDSGAGSWLNRSDCENLLSQIHIIFEIFIAFYTINTQKRGKS